MSPLKRMICCSVLHNSTATIPGANKRWIHTVCQAHIMWFHLMHGLLLPITSFSCSHYDSPLRMRSGPQGTDTAQKAQTTGFVPGQMGIHFFIMRVNANEHNLNEAWLNYSIGRQSKKHSKEALQREAGEPRVVTGHLISCQNFRITVHHFCFSALSISKMRASWR